jgi:hypothetical protein
MLSFHSEFQELVILKLEGDIQLLEAKTKNLTTELERVRKREVGLIIREGVSGLLRAIHTDLMKTKKTLLLKSCSS